jgi:hypothetical protein
MAFRIEVRTGAIVLLTFLAMASAAPAATFDVWHRHWRKGAPGVLDAGPASITFEEKGKKAAHSRAWKYEDIQQLTLSPGELKILTYEDQKWELARDREYVFERLPKDMATQLYPLLRQVMDQRFSANLADAEIRPLWSLPAKLTHGRGGTQGTLTVGEDRIVYQAEKGASHTWRYSDVDNVSRSGPFDLSLVTLEHEGWYHGSPTEFHFQLKGPLAEERYNDLWRRLNRSQGMQISEHDTTQR